MTSPSPAASAEAVAARSSGSIAGVRGLLALIAGALVALGLLEGGGGALWPDVIAAFGVSKGLFGMANGIGLSLSFPILLFGGRLTTRFDPRGLMAWAAAMLIVLAVGVTIGGGPAALVALLVVRGMGIGLLDLAANAAAMDVEQSTGRHVMSPLHAGFSGGTVLGAGIAWLAFAAGGGHRIVFTILGALFAIFIVGAALVRRGSPIPASRGTAKTKNSLALGLFRRADIRAFALMCGVAFAGEGLIAQWIGIYLRDERGYSASIGAGAVITLGAAMFGGRLVNGPMTVKAGAGRALLTQGTMTSFGGLLLVTAGSPGVAIAGCAIAGLGLAGVAPTALSLAGKALPEASGAATGAALIGGYAGGAVVPFIAGLVASKASVRWVMLGVIVAGATVLITGLRLRRLGSADATTHSGPTVTAIS